jgi:Tfp pilus assembly protein PilN
MHTIDLLRGQGVPAKTTLGSAAMVMVIVMVPILAAAAMVDRYLQNKTDIEIKKQAITIEQATVNKFADAVKDKESLQKQQEAVRSELSEVSSCLDNFIQWSPVLKTLVECMPAQMYMSGLRAESTSERQRLTKDNKAGRTVNVTVYKRKLVLDISGSELRDYGDMVQKYSNRLKSSQVLGPKLENIEFSQKPGTAGDLNTVSYTMNLIFKSGSL